MLESTCLRDTYLYAAKLKGIPDLGKAALAEAVFLPQIVLAV